ncbi:exosortase K [Lentisphaerota bacterium WC36G]|nr:exosortase K [Lentisphaerae bacterium WC36]
MKNFLSFLNKNIIRFSFVIMLFLSCQIILMRSFYMHLLTTPTSKIVGLIINENPQFIFQYGFLFSKSKFVINNSCSGINFMLITFWTLFFLISKNINNKFKSFLLIPALVIFSYFFTIIINSMRIVMFLKIKDFQKYFYMNNIPVPHQSLGAIFYLTSLILLYLAIHYYFEKQQKITGGDYENVVEN